MNFTSLGCVLSIIYRTLHQEQQTIRQIKAALGFGYKSVDTLPQMVDHPQKHSAN
jgi:hypothetical protein